MQALQSFHDINQGIIPVHTQKRQGRNSQNYWYPFKGAKIIWKLYSSSLDDWITYVKNKRVEFNLRACT